MAKKTDDKPDVAMTVANSGGGALAMPAPTFMTADEAMGTELLKTKVRPPFMKIVQKQSSQELLDAFGQGALILSPDNLLVLPPKGTPIRIVPVLFYTEYLKLAPIALKGIEPMIADRSYNPSSALGRKCLSRDTWYEPHPNYPGSDKHRYRNAEALSFLCVFEDVNAMQTPFILSFMKGNYTRGQRFCSLITQRQKALFGCVFELSVDPTMARNAEGEWHQYLLDNPKQDPWVTNEAAYMEYRAQHLKFKELYEANELETQYDDADLSTATVAETGSY